MKLILDRKVALCLADMGVDFSKPICKTDLKAAKDRASQLALVEWWAEDIENESQDGNGKVISKAKIKKVLEMIELAGVSGESTAFSDVQRFIDEVRK